MGFAIGAENEFLLTCFVCKNSFGMIASFCGECGCKREQALGVERALANQKVVQNQIETTSRADKISQSVQIQEVVGIPAQPKKKTKKITFQLQLLLQNFRLRIDRINLWKESHRIGIGFVGVLTFLCSSFILTQTYIFASSDPVQDAQKYLEKGVTRQATYFDRNKNVEGAPTLNQFPANYSPWPASDASTWTTGATWNGWTAKAIAWTMPAGDKYDDIRVEIKLKARYTWVAGVFRTVTWTPTEPTAYIKLKYPPDKTLAIYINGYAAGTVGDPRVKPGTYYIYPGPFNISFYGNDGIKSSNSRSLFIDASGEYSLNY